MNNNSYAMNNKNLDAYSKEELIKIIEIYSKNWLAMDGVWFQSIERKFGMEEAMYHDAEAWKRFTVIEARRIKEFLKLPENAGIDGLKRQNRDRRKYSLVYIRKLSCSACQRAKRNEVSPMQRHRYH